MEAPLYNQSGEEVDTIDIPESVFGRAWNPDLVHQVVVTLQANARNSVAHTKDRSEVAGGGRKPWRQKGTGRARHGSIRSPLWTGGGQSFGPRKEKKYAKDVNKKMKREALFAVLSKKLEEGEVLFVDEMAFDEPKTADARKVIESLSEIDGYTELRTKTKNAIFIALGEQDTNTKKSFQNFGNVDLDEVRNLNVLDILNKKYLIIVKPEESFETLVRKFANETTVA